MSSAVLSGTKPIGEATRRDGFIPNGSNVSTHFANNAKGSLLQLRPRPTLTRHDYTLQEHADHLRGAEALTGDSDFTPQHGSRRREFSWGFQPPSDDQTTNSRNRNPLPPEQLGARTPPPLEEIIRRPTYVDAYQFHNARLRRVDTTGSPAARLSRSSTMSDAPSRTDTRRSSIVAFTRGLARHVPDMRMFAPPPGRGAGRLEDQNRRDSQDAAFIKNSSRDSGLPSIPPSATKSRGSHEDAPKLTPIIKKLASQPRTSPSTSQAPGKGSLRDRRKVKLDLSLPSVMPDLPPVRGRPPAGALSSITPSRPRSPKTPWIRDEPPSWELSKLPKSAPIIEEDYIQGRTKGEGNQGGLGLGSGHDRDIFSESPVFQRPPRKLRDRCYISRPGLKRGRSDRSGTSSSTLARTPDETWIPDDVKALQEQQARTNEELNQLGQITKTSRLWRWRWRDSSDEALPYPEASNRRSSINPFKRSARIAEEADDKVKPKQSASSSRPWRGRPAQLTSHNHSSSLAHMALPPTFVPPGVNRVPTPPMFDAQSEVKGKLADFFFDVHGEAARAPRRKAESSSGGLWDSDALLMSLSTDIDAEGEEEEGPEGRPSHVHTPVDFETNGTPGLVTETSRYMGANGLNPGVRVPSPVLRQDSWVHIQQGETAQERAFTVLALKEEDERRKFEWLVPEHLPNSPLCPLHPIYRGPCKGICYWHGRQQSGNRKSSRHKGESGSEWTTSEQWSGESFEDDGKMRIGRGSRGWEASKKDISVQQRKKRRLISLSSP